MKLLLQQTFRTLRKILSNHKFLWYSLIEKFLVSIFSVKSLKLKCATFILILFAQSVKSQSIPDGKFAAFIYSVCNTCITGPASGSTLITSGATPNASTVTVLNISNQGITNLAGIQGFSTLQELYCNNDGNVNPNNLSTISNLPTNLTRLVCYSNANLSTIVSLPSNLNSLQCDHTNLSSLPTMPSTLRTLECGNTQMDNTLFSGLPSGLTKLDVTGDFKMTTISSLPTNLLNLAIIATNVINKPGTTNLPTLPSGLLTLYLDPANITVLPNCPTNLRVYNTSGTLILMPPCTYSLPLSWLSFQTKIIEGNNKIAKLDWLTVSEINVKQFNVERSRDGIAFETISEPIPAYNTTNQNNYQFIDNQPLDGVSYYRVKEVDFDGLKSYSWVRAINNFIGASDFSIYPNPANDELKVDLKSLAGKEVTLIISDLAGKTLYIENIKEASTAHHSLNVSGILNGLYLVRVQSEGNELLPKKLQIIK